MRRWEDTEVVSRGKTDQEWRLGVMELVGLGRLDS